jgi:hypothetical protein
MSAPPAVMPVTPPVTRGKIGRLSGIVTGIDAIRSCVRLSLHGYCQHHGETCCCQCQKKLVHGSRSLVMKTAI